MNHSDQGSHHAGKEMAGSDMLSATQSPVAAPGAPAPAIWDAAALHIWLGQAPLALAVIGDDFRLSGASPAFADLLATTPAALRGKPLGTLLHPDELGSELPAWQALSTASPPAQGQARTTRLIAADGAVVSVAMALGRIATTTGTAFLLTAWPTTAPRAAANAGDDNLVQARRDLALVAGQCSHDLRQHTRLAVSFIEVAVARDHDSSPNSPMRGHLDRARNEAAALGRKLSALTAWLRLREPLTAVATDANGALAAALTGLAPEMTHATVVAESLPRVMATADDLVLVFQELLKNAAEHGAKSATGGGSGTLRIGINAVSQSPGWSTFAVTDNGPGIAANHHDQVFRPFVTLEIQDVDESHRGMGLTRCRAVVERHGGRIWIDPDHHPGTRVLFTWALA